MSAPTVFVCCVLDSTTNGRTGLWTTDILFLNEERQVGVGRVYSNMLQFYCQLIAPYLFICRTELILQLTKLDSYLSGKYCDDNTKVVVGDIN